MDQGPLVTEMIEEGAELACRFDAECRPVHAAFWLKDYDEGKWKFHLASDQIDDTNFDVAYSEVHDLMGPKPSL